MSVAVRIADVTISYEGTGGDASSVVQATDDVSLAIEPGQVVSLIGPSGCGKTTLLNAIAGFLPYVGTITIDGLRPVEFSNTGYLFQQDSLFPWRTLASNVEFSLEVRGEDKRERREKARALLARLGLEGFQNAYPSQVSGGMAKRAALAQALIHRPSLMLLDEPFSALDAFTRAEVENDFLALLTETRSTTVLVTHNIQEAIALSDRVVVLSARPARIVQVHEIELPGPRVLPDVQYTDEFASTEQRVWASLKPEVSRA
jgi:NitT/TauT family transport system ATP-binding protein